MPDGRSRFQSWLGELRRRKVFRVAVAYVVAGWVLIQVADATFEPLGLPGWSMKLVIALVALGFPFACVLAWAYDLTPHGIERTEAATPAAAPPLVDAPRAGPAASEPAVAPAPSARSVAISRLSTMFVSNACDGIAEEIINALCCVRGLQIASRTSSFQFKDRSVDVREIGRTLGVGAVLEGSVRKAGERVRITAQLVNTADGYHLWSESFDRKLEDVFAIQTEIARELVAALRGSLTSGEKELLERGGTRNAEAYDVYLRGQHLLRDGTDLTLPQAAELFRAAIQRDGEFAQAYAGLANALAIKGLWRLDMTPEEFEQAFVASRRALELEPRMPEAYVAQACLLSMQNRVEPANEAFEEALKLNPSSFHANYMYGRHSFAAGDFEKARRLYEQDLPYCMLEGALEKLGRLDESLEAGRRAMLAIERHLQREPGDGRALHLGAVTAAKLGDATRARALSERALAARPYEISTAYNLACAFAILGDRKRSMELLDQATQRGRGNLACIEQDPDLDSLRGEVQFEAIMDRLRAGSGKEG